MTTSNSSTTTIAPIPIHEVVTIRLTKANYLVWNAQLFPYLRSSKLVGYLDGSLVAPGKKIAASMAIDVEHVSNPAYERWYDQDQHLLSNLLSSMTEDVLCNAITATSSKEF
jgi:hypothetical protein